MNTLVAALLCALGAVFPQVAVAQTVTLDFDAPEFAPGDTVGQVGDITFRPAATVFAPTNVVTFSGTQALRVAQMCESPECTNNAYRMEIRFGQPLPVPAGAWLWKRAESVSMRIGADTIASSCFPEGTTCPIYARLLGFDDRSPLPVADSGDVLLLDAFSLLTTGGYRAPITRELTIRDPRASIVQVVLVYGKGTFSHDAQPPFPGEPQIDHLVVKFPETPLPVTTPAAPTIRIDEPRHGSQRTAPYRVRLRGSFTAAGGIAAFCYRVNAPTPSGNDCRNNTEVRPGNTFDIDIPDGLLGGGTNTLAVTVYDLWGQRSTQSVSLTAVAPPPPAIIIYAPTNNQWIDPAQTNALSGTVRTIGALKGFCVLIDPVAAPAPGTCVQHLNAIKTIDTAWQPLFFTMPLTPNRLTTGAHQISVFAVDRWNQMSRADVTVNTPTDFRIVGMEITQGIQTFNIPLNINGFAPYTGVNLRTGVPTVVRVFANTPFAGSYSGVRMLLNGFVPDPRFGERPLGGIVPDSSPATLNIGDLSVPPSVRADPAGAFVFTLPTSWTQQNGLRLQAKLLLPFGVQECPTCTANNEFSVVAINFGPAISFKIASVALTFTGAPPPTDPAIVFAPTLNLLPTPASNVTVLPYAGTIDVSDLVDLVGPKRPDGKTVNCRRDWTTICEDRIYSRMRVWESQHPQDANWVGVGPVDVGLSVAPIAIANSEEPILAVAHEFFHNLGYFHASGACDADVFIMWPPDERGFLHGVGLDRRQLRDASGVWDGRYRIFMRGVPGGPAEYYDLMSYCAKTETAAWISVENWNVFGGLFPNGLFPFLNAFSGTINSPMPSSASAPLRAENAMGAREDAELVTALLEPSGRVQFLSVASAPKKRLKTPFHRSDDYAFVARNLKGVEIARTSAVVQLVSGHQGEAAKARVLLSARMYTKDAASLEVEYKGKSIGKRLRSKSPPSIRFVSVEKGLSLSRAGILDAKWVAADNDGDPLEVRIEFSEGEEKPFRPVFIGPNRGSWAIEGRLLSVTNHGRLRIIANDGFNETEQVVEPIIVTAAPPILRILAPAAGMSFPNSTPIRLHAAAFGDGDAPLAGDQIRWELDGIAVGTGKEVEVRDLKPGKHVAKVTASEGRLTSSQKVEFIVRSSTRTYAVIGDAKND